MDHNTDVPYADVYQPSWVSYYLMKEFPEVQSWDSDLEELILPGPTEEFSESKRELVARALDYIQAIDKIRREEIPVGHLAFVRELVSLFIHFEL